MPYAKGDLISQEAIDGGLEISDELYFAGLDAKISGRETAVIDDEFVIRDFAPGADYIWQDGGWVHVPGEPPQEPVPQAISDRQFFQQLAVMGLISEEEAIAAVSTGTLPPAMAAFVGQLPSDERFAARMALQGATTFLRSNALVGTFGAMQGMTPEEIDNLWRAAALL